MKFVKLILLEYLVCLFLSYIGLMAPVRGVSEGLWIANHPRLKHCTYHNFENIGTEGENI